MNMFVIVAAASGAYIALNRPGVTATDLELFVAAAHADQLICRVIATHAADGLDVDQRWSGGFAKTAACPAFNQLLDGLRIRASTLAVWTRVYFSSEMKNSTSSTGII